jgi:hypothetical protein
MARNLVFTVIVPVVQDHEPCQASAIAPKVRHHCCRPQKTISSPSRTPSQKPDCRPASSVSAPAGCTPALTGVGAAEGRELGVPALDSLRDRRGFLLIAASGLGSGCATTHHKAPGWGTCSRAVLHRTGCWTSGLSPARTAILPYPSLRSRRAQAIKGVGPAYPPFETTFETGAMGDRLPSSPAVQQFAWSEHWRRIRDSNS